MRGAFLIFSKELMGLGLGAITEISNVEKYQQNFLFPYLTW
jgi:hypothetical protein